MDPRPTDSSPGVIAAAVEVLLPRVSKWLNPDDDPEQTRRHLTEMIRTVSGDYDAYRLAKRLDDDFHWSPDAELVDILGAVSGMMFNALTDECAEKEDVG